MGCAVGIYLGFRRFVRTRLVPRKMAVAVEMLGERRVMRGVCMAMVVLLVVVAPTSAASSDQIDHKMHMENCRRTVQERMGELHLDEVTRDALNLYVGQMDEDTQNRFIERELNTENLHNLTDLRSTISSGSQCNKAEKLPSVAICCVQQGMASSVQEWMIFYLLHGVSRIVVYNNDLPNSKGSVNFLNAVKPFVDADYAEVVEWYHYEGDHFRQVEAHNACFQDLKTKYDWIAVFDMDEYLIIHPPNDACMPKYLEGFSEYAALTVRWRLFTPIGVARHNYSRLYLEQYRWESVRTPNTQVKNVLNSKHTVGMTNIHFGDYRKDRFSVNGHRRATSGKHDSYVTYPFQQVELRHFYARDWEYGFLRKICGRSARTHTRQFYRSFVIMEWFDAQCCRQVGDQTRQEVTLRGFFDSL